MPTNFSPLLSVTSISSGLDIPSEDKKRLPPPEILSEPYDCEGMLCVDIKDHLGRHWSIAALKRAHLRRKLRYFKSLPREVINRLLPTPSKATTCPDKSTEEKTATNPKPMSRLMERMKQNKEPRK